MFFDINPENINPENLDILADTIGLPYKKDGLSLFYKGIMNLDIEVAHIYGKDLGYCDYRVYFSYAGHHVQPREDGNHKVCIYPNDTSEIASSNIIDIISCVKYWAKIDGKNIKRAC